MPAHVQNLLVEIDLVCIRLFPHALSLPSCTSGRTAGSRAALLAAVRACGRVHRCGNANLLGLESGLVSLQNHFGILLRVRWVDHEVVVVAPRHDVLAVAREHDLELVEDAVVLVGVSESGSEVLMDRDCLYWLTLHVHVPDFDSKIIAGKDVTTIVAEADIRDGGDDLREEGAR